MELSKSNKLYDSLNLYISSDSYYLQPKENESVLLHIDRVTQEISYQPIKQISSAATIISIFGVLGSIKLLAGHYLIVITERKHVGQICGHDVWRVENIELLPFPKAFIHLSRKQEEVEKIYVNMLKSAFSVPYFYFSYTYDITHTLQRLYGTTPDFLNISMYERADQRFIWNSYLLEQFCIIPELHRFCVPVIHGFVSINTYTFEYGANSEPKTFSWTIISRRSCDRAGTRLHRRGIDFSGNVANFVETEQIVEFENAQSSFVQIRGSVPLYWTQYPNMKLSPPIVIVSHEQHIDACVKHLNKITSEYGKVVFVNLIDQKGREADLENKLRKTLEEIHNDKIKYVAFDFHRECKNMQYSKLNVLIDNVSIDQDQFKYFLIDDKRLVHLQEGVFRTNCIDCLDRTNVVQSMIAWRSLSIVLKKFQLIRGNEEIKGEIDFYRLFQNVWADHADYISVQYTGTKALKTDYTRTGRRTHLGMLKDGYNSLLRYYKNNLKDGFRQDSVDLVLGRYRVKDRECICEKCPIDTSPKWRLLMFQVILLVAIAMFCANGIFPAEYSTSTFFSIVFWGAMIFITLCTMVYYGSEFVDYPQLIPLDLKKSLSLKYKESKNP